MGAVPIPRQRRSGESVRLRWRDLPRELLFVVAGVVVYFGVRGVTGTDATAALQNARRIVSWEVSLGLFVEPELQALVTDSTAALTAMNWVYIWGHWPVIAATLLWLVLRHPAQYRVARNAMLLSGGLGLVFFTAFPVAPPRLVDGLGMVDTVTELSTSYRVLQPPAFVNQFAAMPSLHVGWDLLMGVMIFTTASSLLVRAVGLVLPVLMATSVVLTANHYLVDGVVGAGVVVLSLMVARWWSDRAPVRPERAALQPRTTDTCRASR